MEWIECHQCDEEFKIISSNIKPEMILYCPFCSSEILLEDETEDFEEDLDYDIDD